METKNEGICEGRTEVDRDADIRGLSLRTICAQDAVYETNGERDKGENQSTSREDYLPISRYFCFC